MIICSLGEDQLNFVNPRRDSPEDGETSSNPRWPVSGPHSPRWRKPKGWTRHEPADIAISFSTTKGIYRLHRHGDAGQIA